MENVLTERPPEKVKKNGENKPAYTIPAGEDAKRVVGFVHQTKGGKPILTIDTLKDVIARLKVTVRYNVITKDVEILIPDVEFSPENSYSGSLAWIESQVKSFQMDTYGLDGFLLNIADSNRYNSAVNWITSREWDGKNRLEELYATIDAVDNKAKEALIYRWMITAVAAAFEPQGITAAGMLVLQGAGGMGKTYWFRRLFSDDVRNEVFKDGMELDPHNRDSVKKCVRHWIVELGELDGTFKRSELAALKAFITSDFDVLRLPYARREQALPRRTVLCGTVENTFFLSGQTGNRRFWTIECKKIDSYHNIDMQQVWAQIYQCYKEGEKWQLTDEERTLVNTINESHEYTDFGGEKVKYFYDWSRTPTDWKTAGEIAEEIGMRNIKQSDLISIGIAIMKLNGGVRKRTTKGNILKVPQKTDVFMPPTGEEI